MTTEKEAASIADDYLLMNVGDLLGVRRPGKNDQTYWHFVIYNSNAVIGDIGDVGAIRISIASGAVYFSQKDSKEVVLNSRLASIKKKRQLLEEVIALRLQFEENYMSDNWVDRAYSLLGWLQMEARKSLEEEE